MLNCVCLETLMVHCCPSKLCNHFFHFNVQCFSLVLLTFGTLAKFVLTLFSKMKSKGLPLEYEINHSLRLCSVSLQSSKCQPLTTCKQCFEKGAITKLHCVFWILLVFLDVSEKAEAQNSNREQASRRSGEKGPIAFRHSARQT